MSKFYIEKLIISGPGESDSEVSFVKGLNIIYGPSNTGKTYIAKCVDFLFGSEDNPFENMKGYDCISLIIRTNEGSVKLVRKIDESEVDVLSSEDNIISGKYKLKGSKYEKNISSVWMRLIGVDEHINIITNERFKRQTLTWRTFIHMFMLFETPIIAEKSILLPGTGFANTSSLSALLYLATGKDFGDETTHEDKSIKDAKKSAVISYINGEISRLADRKVELTEALEIGESMDLQTEISNLIEEISNKERTVVESISRNQQLLKELTETNQRLTFSR